MKRTAKQRQFFFVFVFVLPLSAETELPKGINCIPAQKKCNSSDNNIVKYFTVETILIWQNQKPINTSY